jgi:hypothetical protein
MQQGSTVSAQTPLKLNMGSGQNPFEGYINVDKFGNPDVLCDLEVFPWPWETSSVDEVVFSHVLEHLGETTQGYFGIIKELYRICKPDARIHIRVPHPRHQDFMNDPTHVRVITPESFSLFSKANNRRWQEEQKANSPLGLYLDVDFEITNSHYALDPHWENRFQDDGTGKISSELWDAIQHLNNVVKEIIMDVRVVKP